MLVSILMYIIVPALIIIPSSVISQWELHALAVLIPTIIAPLISLFCDILLTKPKLIHKYVVTAIYCYLWSAHIFIIRQLLLQTYIPPPIYIAILILSIISITTSANTISFAAVREFSASTFHF